MKKILAFLFVLVIVTGFSLHAHAELINRGTDTLGNRLIYDSDLEITWYDYSESWNDWQGQMDWASTLTVDFDGTTYDDWRLPMTFNADCIGIDCINSEMGHLFYTELGNNGNQEGCTLGVDCGLVNTGEFQHLESSVLARYWTGTEFSTDPDSAWCFHLLYGYQDYHAGTSYKGHFALAVRPGDVDGGIITTVPEPVSMILFSTGGMVLGMRRMRSRKRK